MTMGHKELTQEQARRGDYEEWRQRAQQEQQAQKNVLAGAQGTLVQGPTTGTQSVLIDHETAMGRVHKLLEELQERLQWVLAAEDASKPCQENSVIGRRAAMSSRLGMELEAAVASVTTLERRLQALLARVVL